MQEIRRFKPSTVSGRFSVTAGFYRTAVIDGLLEHSPAEHVRRPSVPAVPPCPPNHQPSDSPTCNSRRGPAEVIGTSAATGLQLAAICGATAAHESQAMRANRAAISSIARNWLGKQASAMEAATPAPTPTPTQTN